MQTDLICLHIFLFICSVIDLSIEDFYIYLSTMYACIYDLVVGEMSSNSVVCILYGYVHAHHAQECCKFFGMDLRERERWYWPEIWALLFPSLSHRP